MKQRPWTTPAATISALAGLALAGMTLVRSPHVRADEGNNDESKIQQGFAIAPVPLNLAGRNRALVGLGSYIVNALADCNGCHSADPATEFSQGGNPYLRSPVFSGTIRVNPDTYLAGGRDFGPFANIPHLYSRNLTPDKNGLPAGGHTFPEFLDIMRRGTDFDHLHPNCAGVNTPPNCLQPPFNGEVLQVMPWPVYRNMTDRDLLAIYTYLSAIPCSPGPSGLDPKLFEQNVCH
ncbi:MAG TPA: hypothetical protein VFA28_00915 [Bryobacteraceae bacterium]|nr:hypothetical protein [Bryobacteraceae bacterium]